MEGALRGVVGLFLLTMLLASVVEGTAPCTGEVPDICGVYPSTPGYAPTPLCDLTCDFDLCGICDGLAPLPNVTVLTPTGVSSSARLGGSVASWGRRVAVSQHVAQRLPPLVNAPVVTWDEDGEQFVLPTSNAITDGLLPVGLGYAVAMSENYLVVGCHTNTTKVTQLWVRGSSPWLWLWTANDPCPGNYFGFAVAVDETLPGIDGVYGVVVSGDPTAQLAGRAYVYFTYSEGIVQTLYAGTGNETTRFCFGESVAADSGYLAVGAPSYTTSATKDGAVFLYAFNAGTLQYDLVVQLAPPSPTTNGGFGESVALWNNILVVGDNKRTVYEYRIVGLTAVPVTLGQPSGLNLESHFGYGVAVYDRFLAAGDDDFVPTPSTRGRTFVYTRNPAVSFMYRESYHLDDGALRSYPTRYGASVSVRGGCYVASGAPGLDSGGGVYLQDLCNDDCYGCDEVLNSCKFADACDVCEGDNTTCTDCLGVVAGSAVLDACGVCNGANNTCVLPVPTNLSAVCGSTSYVRLNQSLPGTTRWTLVDGGSKGVSVIRNSNQLQYKADPYVSGTDYVILNASRNGYWALLNVTVILGDCVDCLGVLNGGAVPDDCGVCGGDSSSCAGCDGIPNSGVAFDPCGVCGGDSSTCLYLAVVATQTIQCTSTVTFRLNYVPLSTPVTWYVVEGDNVVINAANGFARWTNPGVVGMVWFVIGATSLLDGSISSTSNVSFDLLNCSDCNGVQLGLQLPDECGVCGGNSSSCAGCDGIPNSGLTLNACGQCLPDNSTCYGCDGVLNSGLVLDRCLVCGGDGSTCSGENQYWMWYILVVPLAISAIGGTWVAMRFVDDVQKKGRRRKKPSVVIPSVPPPASGFPSTQVTQSWTSR